MNKYLRKSLLSPLDLPVVFFLISGLLGIFPAYNRSLVWAPLIAIYLGGLIYFLVSRGGIKVNVPVLAAKGSVLAAALVALYYVTQSAHFQTVDKVEPISKLALWIGRFVPPFVIWEPFSNSMATLLEGMLFLAAGLALRERKSSWQVALWIATAWITLGLLVSESRGAWLAVGIAALVWLALYFRLARWAAALGVLGLVLLIVVVVIRGSILALNDIPLVNRSLAPLFVRPDRLAVYQGSIYLLQDMPFTGIGLGGQFAMLYSRYVLMIQVPFLDYSHNLYLEIWLEQGLLGLTAWIWLIGSLYGSVGRERASSKGDILTESAWLGVTAILLHGVTDARQYIDLWCWLPVFLLLGIYSAGLPRRVESVAAWKWLWAPLSASLVLVGMILVVLPVRAGSWWADLGSLKQARAGLSPSVTAAESSLLLQEALSDYQRSIALAPNQRPAHLHLGMVSLDRRDFGSAVQQFELAYHADPANPTTQKALGLAYTWTGEIDKASRLLSQVNGMVQELNDWGWWWGTQGRMDLQIDTYRVSLSLKPDQPDIDKALKKLKNP